MLIACYSYVRFSTPEQLRGDSLRRQLTLGRGWVERHPDHYLDESLRLQDLGVSGFRGRNRTEGALAGFIKAVESRRVKPGSVLLVESLDRLSREEVEEALELFLKIIRLGIVIVTLAPPETEFRKGHLDMTKLILAILVMSRAHEESATKSLRLSEMWAAKRAKIRERKMTAVAPGWLELNEDKTEFVPIAVHTETVQMIFAWAVEGLGVRAITTRLIELKRPPMGRAKYWQQSYIPKILRNRAVLGEFTPHQGQSGRNRKPAGETLLDYYPRIINDKVFYRAQAALDKRKFDHGLAKGHSETVRNLFTGLLRDARDGATFIVANKGEGTDWLINGAAHRAMAGEHSPNFSYPLFEEAVLHFLQELRTEDIFPDREDADQMQSDFDVLEGRLMSIRDRAAKIKRRLEDDLTADPDELLDSRDKLLKQAKDTEAEIESLRLKLRQHESNSLGDTKKVLELLSRSKGKERVQLRSRIKEQLRHLIREVWILTTITGSRWENTRVCFAQIHFLAGGVRQLVIFREPKGMHLVFGHEQLTDRMLELDLRCYREWPEDDKADHSGIVHQMIDGSKVLLIKRQARDGEEKSTRSN